LITTEDQQQFFFNHTVEYTKKFLEEIYMATVLPDAAEAPADMMKKQFTVTLLVDTINGRKKLNFNNPETVQSEITLTQKMLEKNIKLDLDVVLTISSTDKGKSADFLLVDSDSRKKSALLSFGNFFSVNVATALRYYLKKRWEESTNNVSQ